MAMLKRHWGDTESTEQRDKARVISVRKNATWILKQNSKSRQRNMLRLNKAFGSKSGWGGRGVGGVKGAVARSPTPSGSVDADGAGLR